ncbi:MAG: ABC transporter permease subunit [Caldilinea sp.]|nr:ABC transporter permease subunit [Caldilinea sp.]MCB9115798.1 ABC transporter permease subunit [Caldilineaceae bacterium]MCB9119923.1 ABC transporter permease subunit [Caldilineaceae bacterium]
MATTVQNPPRRSRLTWTWLGLVPFFLFAILFIFLPSASLFIDSFRTLDGGFTFANIAGLFQPPIPESYWLSIRVSAMTAVGGGLLGFFMAYALTVGNLPRWLRPVTLTFAGVASNFAGVPLAFAFISTLGRTGFVTVILRDLFGWNIYGAGFNLYSFIGLSVTYMYFQFPLMLLIMIPAIEGLKRDWREAAENLGASTFQYWWRVGLPILMPSLLGTMLLLFGNAFGAYATAYALTGGTLNLITIQIGAQMRGDVLRNPNLGYAMALGMVVIMAVTILGYSWLQRISERWLK